MRDDWSVYIGELDGAYVFEGFFRSSAFSMLLNDRPFLRFCSRQLFGTLRFIPLGFEIDRSRFASYAIVIYNECLFPRAPRPICLRTDPLPRTISVFLYKSKPPQNHYETQTSML